MNTSTYPDCHDCKESDRYVSFEGIDCNGNAGLIMAYIERNQHDAGGRNQFWEYFTAKRHPRSGPLPDDLFLVHSHINQIRELFEECGDEEALALLMSLEVECC